MGRGKTGTAVRIYGEIVDWDNEVNVTEGWAVDFDPLGAIRYHAFAPTLITEYFPATAILKSQNEIK